MLFSLLAKPGTVGEAAVPPKSPANWIFPFTKVVASGIVADAIWVSTYVFTAFWVGYKVLLDPRVVVVDLFAKFSLASKAVWVAVEIGLFESEVLSTLLKPTADLSNVCHVLSPLKYCAVVPAAMVFSLVSKAAWVAVEIGLFKSEVLSTLFKTKLIFASVIFVAPVPPFWIATTPETLSAVTAAYAKGTVESGLLLNITNCWQSPLVLNSTFKDLVLEFQTTELNELEYPPVWFPEPIIRFTIPNSSVVVWITSWYSNWERLSIKLKRKQTGLLTIGLFWILTPGIFWPFGL